MFAFLKLIVAPVSSWLAGRNEVVKINAKSKAEVAKTKAKAEAEAASIKAEVAVARATENAKAEGSYDLEAQRQMQHSWKDEYLVLVMSLPFIGSFIPVVQDSVAKGWTYVAQAPQWYQVAFIGIIMATFGLRWYSKSFAKK